jgi:hypothetical protein
MHGSVEASVLVSALATSSCAPVDRMNSCMSCTFAENISLVGMTRILGNTMSCHKSECCSTCSSGMDGEVHSRLHIIASDQGLGI